MATAGSILYEWPATPPLAKDAVSIPPELLPLLDDGLIDGVARPLQSGKEAQVYLVHCGDEIRAAKVYTNAHHRSFKNRSVYGEGRRVRNARDQRAMNKRSRHGRARDEEHWKSAEADIIQRLYHAGVRVPEPHGFMNGVLLMEAIFDERGDTARRLVEINFDREEGRRLCEGLMKEVARMLSVGIVHADLSLFNILLGVDGPVIIDFPQAVDAARNNNAKDLLLRDVANLTGHLMPGVPADQKRYGHEMWDLFERQMLDPDTPLTGRFDLPKHEVDAEALLYEMLEIEEDAVLADAEPEFTFEPHTRKGSRVVPPGDDAEALKRRAKAAAKKIQSTSRRRKKNRN